MNNEKINFLDGIKSHFEEIEIKIIEVPEWGLTGDKAIYAKPFNMLEKSKLFIANLLICSKNKRYLREQVEQTL